MAKDEDDWSDDDLDVREDIIDHRSGKSRGASRKSKMRRLDTAQSK